MLYRKATINDVPELKKLSVKFLKEIDTIISDNETIKSFQSKKDNYDELIKEHLIKQIRSPEGRIIICIKDDKIIGYLLAYIKDNMPLLRNEKIGYIGHLYVKKSFRNKGISSELMNKAIEWFKEQNIKFASLGVNLSNTKARNVYYHWGFIDYEVQMIKNIEHLKKTINKKN